LLLVSAGTYMLSYIITSSILACWAYTVDKASGVFLFLFYLGILFTPFIIVAFLISFLLNKLFIKLHQVIDNYGFSKKHNNL
jgi:cytochrome c biogenesis protein CcdA